MQLLKWLFAVLVVLNLIVFANVVTQKMNGNRPQHNPAVVAVLASVNEEKISLLAVCGKEAVAKGIKAGDIIKAIAPIVGGRGGGKPDSAMGGGTNLLKIDDALAAVDDFVSERL